LARYDLAAVARVSDPARWAQREPGLWRYRELLPIRDERSIISLGEPATPLFQLKALGRAWGHEELWLKDESRLPTGTFKARGMAVAVSMLVEQGVKRVAIPSAGNAAEALAAYGAKAGLDVYVFMPQDAPLANRRAVQALGAHLFLVEGLISDAGKIVAQGRERCGWFDLSTMKEPYRVEGKKTMGIELAEQLGWRLPDVIVYPTGGGTGLIGMWKAFGELDELGWINEKRPRMVSVQAAGCAPIVKAFREGRDAAELWPNAQTMAAGLRVPKPLGDFLILRAIRESSGTALAVSEDEISETMAEVARLEGSLICPEGAAALAGARQLIRDQAVVPSEKIVVFNTGSGLKHIDLLSDQPEPPVLDPKQPIDYQALIQQE
jgi:threonine synthase